MAQVKVIKCLQFRIYPDAAQQVLIWKTFGCCRWMWNHLLDERIKSNKVLDGVKFKNTTPAHFKKIPENSFLKEVDALALANEQLNVNRACSKCFAKGKTPKFRAKRNERRSYTTNAVNNNIELSYNSNDGRSTESTIIGKQNQQAARRWAAGYAAAYSTTS